MLVAENDNPSARLSTRGSSNTMKRYHSLADIRRVFWDCQCDGFRLDGAVENLGLIREPTEGELVGIGDHNERHFEGNHARLVTRKVEIPFERV